MDGLHDCGGIEGYGSIELESENAPKFYEGWERETFGLYWAVNCLGYWPEEAVRHSVERMGAIEYLVTPYYEHWLASMEILLREYGHITVEELETKQNEIRAGKRQRGHESAY